MDMVTAADLIAWAERPAPRFERLISTETAWHASLPPVIPLKHVLGPVPEPGAIELFERNLGDASRILSALYCRHDGAHLFGVANAEAYDSDVGFHFCPISEMGAEKDNISEWFEDSDDDNEPHDENGWLLFYNLPAWFDSVIVFGRFGDAAERLLVPSEGPYAGQVFLFKHDPLGLLKLADSVEIIFRRIIGNPLKFFSGHEGNKFHGINRYVTDA